MWVAFSRSLCCSRQRCHDFLSRVNLFLVVWTGHWILVTHVRLVPYFVVRLLFFSAASLKSARFQEIWSEMQFYAWSSPFVGEIHASSVSFQSHALPSALRALSQISHTPSILTTRSSWYRHDLEDDKPRFLLISTLTKTQSFGISLFFSGYFYCSCHQIRPNCTPNSHSSLITFPSMRRSPSVCSSSTRVIQVALFLSESSLSLASMVEQPVPFSRCFVDS